MTGRVIKVVGVSAALLGIFDLLMKPDLGTIAIISCGLIIVAAGKLTEHKRAGRR